MMYCGQVFEKEANSDEGLCRLAQSGDREAEELLAVRYFSVVKACARPYFLIGGDGEDLIQEGMLGLIKAVRSYEPSRGVPFAAFARICITRRVYTAVTSAAAAKNEPLNSSERITKAPLFDEHAKAVHSVADPVNLVIDREEQDERLQRLHASLSAFEGRVLALYLEGCSYEEMAAEVGKPLKSVDNAIQRIRRKAVALFPNEDR